MDKLASGYKALVRKAWQFFYLSQRSWSKPIEQAGLTISSFPVLEMIVSKPGINQQEITDEISLDKSCTSRACKALEANGFIRREKNPNCPHGYLCYPTEKAPALVDEIISQECRYINALFAQEDPAELERAIALLAHLTKQLRDEKEA